MIKNYNVTLDHEIVEAAKKILKKEKLSPTINDLLKRFVAEKKQEKKQNE